MGKFKVGDRVVLKTNINYSGIVVKHIKHGMMMQSYLDSGVYYNLILVERDTAYYREIRLKKLLDEETI